jgi:hypothetical protein
MRELSDIGQVFVVPAKDGTPFLAQSKSWIPAFAGMTTSRAACDLLFLPLAGEGWG